MNGAQLAVDAVGGSQTALAAHLGITAQAVQAWVQTGRVPARRARKVAEITGIPLHVLNPDVFPAADSVPHSLS
jgi:DNA-binding transcriptional regulator YdaS (Cro superfamily)